MDSVFVSFLGLQGYCLCFLVRSTWFPCWVYKDSVFVSLLGLHGFLVGSTRIVSLFPCLVYMVSLLGLQR